ncbi:hypothetical protein Vadar_021954 [Vaccinium darrowii]|uniref:Uncharacterized protein n=1 Tax=Vaccinium darrowii TaxID=229202 RepID=A0ACB7XJ46_9ERIC|nr:hypothetical protein Vadar_021954 [Vaccinium darrowii]
MSSVVKKRFVSNLIKSKRPDFILIQETKLMQLDNYQINRLWYESEVQAAVAEAEGMSGGLVTLWNAQTFKAEEVITSRRYILVRGVFVGNFPRIIVNVYTLNETSVRRLL